VNACNFFRFGDATFSIFACNFFQKRLAKNIVAKITPCFQNRKSAVIRDLPNGYGAGTTELHVLRDVTNTLYMPYILLICKTHVFIADGISAFTGTAGQQRVGKGYIANYLIPLPPIQEQIRIVNSVQIIFESLDELL